MALPRGFIDQKAVAVEPPQGDDLAPGQVRKQGFVEIPRGFPTVARTVGPTDDVVRGVRRQGRQDAFNVVVMLVSKVRVDLLVHLLGRERHDQPPGEFDMRVS